VGLATSPSAPASWIDTWAPIAEGARAAATACAAAAVAAVAAVATRTAVVTPPGRRWRRMGATYVHAGARMQHVREARMSRRCWPLRGTRATRQQAAVAAVAAAAAAVASAATAWTRMAPVNPHVSTNAVRGRAVGRQQPRRRQRAPGSTQQ
jgi:hypothetical protein